MALQTLGIGTAPNDGTGDNLRTGGDKINDNFSEIYTLLGTGTALSSGLSASASVITLAGPSITGVASFADGSASSPSITNTGDDNTGIFFGSADQVDISTGGTARLTVSSTAVTSAVGIVIPDAGNIGSASDTDAIAISSGGDVSLSGGSLSLIDQEKVILGSNSDISLAYDETTTDSLVISSDVDDAALGIVLQADAGADAGDEWKMNFANGGVFTFGNDIASAGTHTTLLTITPNSTAASSTHAFIGALSASSTITATGGVIVPDDGDVGSASATDAMQISSGGIVTFKDDIKIKDGGTIGNASVADVMTLASTGIVTFKDDILIKDGGTIGSASDADAITIASDGVTTFSQKDVHSVGLSVKNGSSSAGFVEFFENSGNGTNKVTLIGPASTSDVTLTLGSTTGTVATTDDVAGEATALAIALG